MEIEMQPHFVHFMSLALCDWFFGLPDQTGRQCRFPVLKQRRPNTMMISTTSSCPIFR